MAVTQPVRTLVPRTPLLTPSQRPDGRGRRVPVPAALPGAEAASARAAGSFLQAPRHGQLVPLSWLGRERPGGLHASHDQNSPLEKQPDMVLGWGQGTPNLWGTMGIHGAGEGSPAQGRGCSGSAGGRGVA